MISTEGEITPVPSLDANPFTDYTLPDWLGGDPSPCVIICPGVVFPVEPCFLPPEPVDPALLPPATVGLDPVIEGGDWTDPVSVDPIVDSWPDPTAKDDGGTVFPMPEDEIPPDPLTGCWFPLPEPLPDESEWTVTTCAVGEEAGDPWDPKPIRLDDSSPLGGEETSWWTSLEWAHEASRIDSLPAQEPDWSEDNAGSPLDPVDPPFVEELQPLPISDCEMLPSPGEEVFDPTLQPVWTSEPDPGQESLISVEEPTDGYSYFVGGDWTDPVSVDPIVDSWPDPTAKDDGGTVFPMPEDEIPPDPLTGCWFPLPEPLPVEPEWTVTTFAVGEEAGDPWDPKPIRLDDSSPLGGEETSWWTFWEWADEASRLDSVPAQEPDWSEDNAGSPLDPVDPPFVEELQPLPISDGEMLPSPGEEVFDPTLQPVWTSEPDPGQESLIPVEEPTDGYSYFDNFYPIAATCWLAEFVDLDRSNIKFMAEESGVDSVLGLVDVDAPILLASELEPASAIELFQVDSDVDQDVVSEQFIKVGYPGRGVDADGKIKPWYRSLAFSGVEGGDFVEDSVAANVVDDKSSPPELIASPPQMFSMTITMIEAPPVLYAFAMAPSESDALTATNLDSPVSAEPLNQVVTPAPEAAPSTPPSPGSALPQLQHDLLPSDLPPLSSGANSGETLTSAPAFETSPDPVITTKEGSPLPKEVPQQEALDPMAMLLLESDGPAPNPLELLPLPLLTPSA